MPENRTFITIPPLALSAGSGNENDFSSDGRSTGRSIPSGRRSNVSGMKRKLRVSNGRCIIQNGAIKACTTHKPASVRAKLPRALLSTTHNRHTYAPIANESKLVDLSVSRPFKAPSIQRQNTQTLFRYRVKRSISAMDIKDFRRTGNFPPMPMQMPTDFESESSTDAHSASSIGSEKKSKVELALTSYSSEILCKAHNHELIIAEMKVANCLILNSWRKKRNDIKRLINEINALRQKNRNIKAQLYIMNSLFDQERLRNQDITIKLKKLNEELNHTKRSCESLTTSLISLKSEKTLMENQLCIKEQECEGVNTILTQTKAELFKSMARERESQSKMSDQQRKVQSLETQKLELLKEIADINSEAVDRELKLRELVQQKETELDDAVYERVQLKQEVVKLKEKEVLLKECLEQNAQLKKDMSNLQTELNTLQECLGATLGNRIKTCWNTSLAYQKTTMQMFHWFAYHMLPATPPPKITKFPFSLAFEKALRFVGKRET